MSRQGTDGPQCIEFVPARHVERYRALAAAEPPAIFPSPLSDLARVFYTRGGCWNLALAMHAATGLAIELAYRRGVPRHAYVLDETYGVDAFGPKQLRYARAGFDEVKRVSPAELLEELDRAAGGELVAEVERDDCRVCAEAAAAFLLVEFGWQGPPVE